MSMPNSVGFPLNGAARKQAVSKLAFDIRNWAALIEDRNLVATDEMNALALQAKNADRLASELDKDSAFAVDTMKLVGAVQQILEKEMKSQVESEHLKAAEREECPPKYRAFVNRYFEVLSGMEDK